MSVPTIANILALPMPRRIEALENVCEEENHKARQPGFKPLAPPLCESVKHYATFVAMSD